MSGTAVERVPAELVRADRALRILRPVAAPAELIQSQNQARDFILKVLEKDRDYGPIPGVKKSTLFKPGAEKITLGFGCSAAPRILEREIDHDRAVPWVKQKKRWTDAPGGGRSFTWEKEEGESLGLYRYVVQVDIVDEHGQIRGSGIGSCSSMESKYIDRPRDSENTILKMAIKRAHVAAVLSTFGLSEQFAEDVDDARARAADPVVEPAVEISPLEKTWPKWPNFPYAGAKFRDIPTKVLTEQFTKVRRNVEKATAEGNVDLARLGEKLLENIEFVLEDRRAHPADAPAADATASPTMEPPVIAGAAVEDGDDGQLPF
jgi:hypothetical protein